MTLLQREITGSFQLITGEMTALRYIFGNNNKSFVMFANFVKAIRCCKGCKFCFVTIRNHIQTCNFYATKKAIDNE